MQNGRPSSSTAQHVINMAGMDPGLGISGSTGGGGMRSAGMAGNLMSPPPARSPAGGVHPSSIPPGAYHTPSQQQRHSPHPPGSLTPDQHNSVSMYASPRLAGGLSPTLPTTSAQLARSQSLGHAAYQQYHLQQQQQQQQQLQQRQMEYHHASGTALPLSPTAADMYGTSGQHHLRDRSQQYSDGVPTANYGQASLLPTINTQIPASSLMSSPYSPTNRQLHMAGSPSQRNHYSGFAAPRSPNMSYGSPYIPTTQLGQRPMSMLDQSYGHTSYGGAHTISPVASSSKRASVSAISSSSVLPQVAPTAFGDSLPLYSTNAGSAGHRPPSTGTGLGTTIGAPPRTSLTGLGAGNPAYSPVSVASTSQQPDRMSVEPGDGGRIMPRKERRGTVTSQDTVTRSALGEFEAWDRQQRAVRKRTEGFRRVRDMSDLKVNLDLAQQGKGRRADPMGGYVSPLKALTAYLHHTYHLVNPAFFYELSFNPRRVLTKPSKPAHNEGHDNEHSDYILYVNDWLGSEESNRYLILDILGQGTFGQVVKCQNMKTREIVAVKVIKNKPAYFNQSMMEVTILEMLNGNWDPNDEHHILRLRDTFIHAKHLCLVFELLSSNLYELIKQNSFRGLSTSLVCVFTTQLLDALTVLNEARLIHCDLKPENILLKTLQTPSIKLVDFGSACHERQTVYTYIQSRFYRSPEVLLGLPYSAAIDMWSLGCIAIELFLGLPLFPGTSEYNQVCRIVEMLGLPPRWMLEQGKQTGEFFNVYTDEYGRRQYKLKGLDQYSKEHSVAEQPSKRYFQATTLPDIVKTYPMSRKSGKPADVQKEMAKRASFIDFVSGLLNMDPNLRWTPQQAKLHPFITNEKFTQPWKPSVETGRTIDRRSTTGGGPASQVGSSDPNKHPFGGLPDTPTRSTGRSYHDAAAYNQHLAQQQAYNTAHQARKNQVNNPYASGQDASTSGTNAVQPPPPPPTVATRSRSNTLTRMDVIPPQLAKMGLEPGKSLTPVLNRGEARQRAGKEYEHLDLLQQQAEQAHQVEQAQQAHQAHQAHQAQQAYQAVSHASGGGGHQASFSVVVDGHQPHVHVAAPPPAAFAATNRHSGNVNGAAAGLSFDPYQPDLSSQLMPAMQPVQYHTTTSPSNSTQARLANRHSIAVPHVEAGGQPRDGYGGLSDMMFNDASGQGAPNAGLLRYSIGGPPPSHHHYPGASQSSPVDHAAAGGLPQYQTKHQY